MICPDALDALLEAGASAEMIVAAVKAEIASDGRKAVDRRANDAERQRRSRSNRASGASRDVAVTKCDKEKSPQTPLKENPPSPKGDIPPAEIDQAFEDYRTTAAKHDWPVPRRLTDKWRRGLKTRLREHGADGWRSALDRAGRSRMLGRDPPKWFDFEFLVRNPENIEKLLSGKYDDPFDSKAANDGGNDRKAYLAKKYGTGSG